MFTVRRAAPFMVAALFMIAVPPSIAQTPPPPPVTVAAAERGDVPVFTSGVGTVQAYRSVLVRARVDGTLEQIAFREGQDVKPGDLLAVIDPRPYAAVLAQAEAKRAADLAQLQNAKIDLQRYVSLARTSFASRQQVDTQTALVNQYSANLAGDDAAIQSAQLNLSFCRITSPIDGVVGLRQVDIGNLIHATDATGIVTITQIHPISLVFTLPETELPKVHDAIASAAAQRPEPKVANEAPQDEAGTGLPVLAYTSDGGRLLAQGTLLTPNNSIDTTTGTISMKATFANRDRALWPGQFVMAKLELGLRHHAVTVPDDAVQHGPDGLYLYVVDAQHRAERRDVKVSYSGEGRSIVSQGLNGGEQVIVSGQVRVQDGQPVDARPQARS